MLQRLRGAVRYAWRVLVSVEARLAFFRMILEEERRCPPGLRLRDRIWALRQGHFSSRLVAWDLHRGNVHEFIPEIPYLRAHPLNGPFSRLIDGKLQLYFTLHRFHHLLPRLFLHVNGGTAYGWDPALPRCRPFDPEQVLELLALCPRLFIKPDTLAEGAGVFSLEQATDGLRISGRPVTRAGAVERLRGLSDHLVAEQVGQHDLLRGLFPGSVNTLRLVTLRPDGVGEPRCLFAHLRVGTAASAPADNVGRGGLCCRIDLATGVTSAFCSYPTSLRRVWHERHPETGARLEGIVIPGWTAIRDGVVEVARQLPMVPWMGFDVVVTPDGFRILEINSQTSIFIQAWEPLGRDPDVVRFLRPRVRGGIFRTGALACPDPVPPPAGPHPGA